MNGATATILQFLNSELGELTDEGNDPDDQIEALEAAKTGSQALTILFLDRQEITDGGEFNTEWTVMDGLLKFAFSQCEWSVLDAKIAPALQKVQEAYEAELAAA